VRRRRLIALKLVFISKQRAHASIEKTLETSNQALRRARRGPG
jgi:hypothetical protein